MSSNTVGSKCNFQSIWHNREIVAAFTVKHYRDFAGGPVIENPSSNAGDVGFILGQGTRIPQAVGPISQN